MKKSLIALVLGTMFLLSSLTACAEQDFKELKSGLMYKDEVVGSGRPAIKGTRVKVHYTGTLYDTGKQFDSSVDSGRPFEFLLGAGRVIQGWDEGVKGMKIGGKRILVIPHPMAYGKNGIPGVIPPKATLKFVVELLDME